jgi:hypothetical protein
MLNGGEETVMDGRVMVMTTYSISVERAQRSDAQEREVTPLGLPHVPTPTIRGSAFSASASTPRR